MMSKVVSVFGGTKGIGKAIALQFLQDGFKVAIFSRDSANVNAALQDLQSANETSSKTDQSLRVLGLTCNVKEEKQIIEVFKKTQQQLGPINFVINAAGINIDGLLVKASSADINSLISTNLVGSILTSKVAVRFLLQQKSGCIINVGSIIGVTGNVGQSVYSASKSGLIGFTKSLAKEVAGRGIRVNLLIPGFISTNMTASLKLDEIEHLTIMNRLGTPTDVAFAAKLLANNRHMNGVILPVDGGLHLVM